MVKNAYYAVVNNDTNEAILFETEWDAGNYIIAHADDYLSWITDWLTEDQTLDDYYAIMLKRDAISVSFSFAYRFVRKFTF